MGVVVVRPILVCLLGSFRLLKRGQSLAIRGGGKTEALLYHLALEHERGLRRNVLLEALWPGVEATLAGQSLNSLVYSLNRLLGDAIENAPPVLHDEGRYRLNRAAGIAVDLERFATLAADGERHGRRGDPAAAADCYRAAVAVYGGDLIGEDVHALVERERLRPST